MRHLWICTLALAVALFGGRSGALADYKKNVGYTALKNALGSAIPDGSGLSLVTQTEAAAVTDHDGNEDTDPIKVWMPDPGHPEFRGKKILNRSLSLPYYSGHATGVGANFYGVKRSMAPGIRTIESFLATHWLGTGFLGSDGTLKPQSSTGRIANHSWVASTKGNDANVLRRLDWLAATDESIQVVGPCRPNNPLLGSAFNSIAVGQETGENGIGTAAVDDVYTAGRACPQLIAPLKTASAAAPVVAAAAALLIELGHSKPGLSTDPHIRQAVVRSGDAVQNAERSEVVKAALMAGADRVTRNAWADEVTAVDIEGYRRDPEHRTANGLDRRYGAGQVNIEHSYRILDGGEQNSSEDQPAAGGAVGPQGFDYDPAFGGADGSNDAASYYFSVDKDERHLWAALVWNIAVDAGAGPYFVGEAALYDLDLVLYDVTDPAAPRQVAASTSSIDNTENLWVALKKDHRYRMRVEPGAGQGPFTWDYGLAWRIGRQVD